ncbi:hypothetical protein GGR30_000190 [Martelella radicis]|uniref:Uncharacterized protein n=1 Tax=Martelella radicis TaxID=1397476 RepID=A0A7W6P834_9HYPH|nr:hypothetical protein [Martelella radicis]
MTETPKKVRVLSVTRPLRHPRIVSSKKIVDLRPDLVEVNLCGGVGSVMRRDRGARDFPSSAPALHQRCDGQFLHVDIGPHQRGKLRGNIFGK